MKKSELQEIIREEISTVINESPDEWYAENGRSINWRDGDPVVFGYFDDVMYTSLEPNEHWQKRNDPWTHSSLGDWIEDSIYEGDIPEPAGWPSKRPITRDAFTYAGRFWLDKLVISFWEYPKNAKELDKTIDDINKKIGPGYKIDDDWEIDLGLSDFRSSKLAQIGSYKSSKEATPADKGQAHIAFGKQGNVPSGVGSKFKFKNKIPGETVAQMRARTNINENKTKMKKSELQEIIREEISKTLNEQLSNLRLNPGEKLLNKMTVIDYDGDEWQLNIVELDNELDPANNSAGEEMYIVITGKFARDTTNDSIMIPRSQWEDFKHMLNMI